MQSDAGRRGGQDVEGVGTDGDNRGLHKVHAQDAWLRADVLPNHAIASSGVKRNIGLIRFRACHTLLHM